ncbi:diguanylate cyclase domain-containing protein [Neptuniibacter halophilus]|uniref:diguanylate cyclase domain-containing protein n=1 Tax=Neptuniibacter halophilus TaxID=651666 RepID=UPI0025731F8B|nr:diguanylate cyclase [Neptuniibacter halophilus]
MLSQRLTKVLLLMAQDASYIHPGREELAEVYHLFVSTLDAFESGGSVIDGHGVSQPFSASDDMRVLFLINKARVLLTDMQPDLERVLQQPDDRLALQSALNFAKENNLALLNLMNELTSRTEMLSQQKTQSLRWIQTLAFGLALFNFLVIIRQFQQRSRQAESQVQDFINLVDTAATSLILLNQRRQVLLANKMSQELFGYTEQEFLRLTEGQLFSQKNNGLVALSRGRGPTRVEVTERQLTLNEQDFIILTVSDISRYAEQQAQLSHLANHDALTGLVNRRALFDRLDMELARAERSGTGLAVMFIDLDRFKPVNDSLGHAAGDEVLVQFSRRLIAVFRASDTLCRFGGDEFVLLLPGVTEKEQLLAFRNSICALLDEPFCYENETISLGASIGEAVYPEDATTAAKLIELADQQMYQNKQSRQEQV